MNGEESLGCVVAFWHPSRGPCFHIYHGLLFGLPLAVTSFNRFSKLAEAFVRRILFMLFSMYFDDGTFQDWMNTAASSQKSSAEFTKLLDSSWAAAKNQPASKQADFLGTSPRPHRLTQGSHPLLATSPAACQVPVHGRAGPVPELLNSKFGFQTLRPAQLPRWSAVLDSVHSKSASTKTARRTSRLS
jgi:hypothetical protein